MRGNMQRRYCPQCWARCAGMLLSLRCIMHEATYILTMWKLRTAQKIGHATRYAIISVKALLMRIFKSQNIGLPLTLVMVLILVLCILFPKNLRSMADVAVWGLLPKAQDDATTIDDEINAAVAAHNDDPTAHMAAGQSIDVHRVNTIIDHPAGSVVGDKIARLHSIRTNFTSFDGMIVYGLAEPYLGAALVY